jgi:hypothetical protein
MPNQNIVMTFFDKISEACSKGVVERFVERCLCTRICGETGFDYNAGICREFTVGYFGGKCPQKCLANSNYLSCNRSTGDFVQWKNGWFGSKRWL